MKKYEFKNEFPVEVLPQKLLQSIDNDCKSNPALRETMYMYLLNGCGAAIAHKYELMVKNKWIERSNLWTIMVAPSGIGKSNTMNKIIDVFDEYENSVLEKDYQKRIWLYDEFNKRKKEVEKVLSNKENPDSDVIRNFTRWLDDNQLSYLFDHENHILKNMKKPELHTLVRKKGTMEGFEKNLQRNEGRQVIIVSDEIKGFFDSLNRYTKGDDESALLQLYDYKGDKKENASEENTRRYKDKTVSIIGATQLKNFDKIFTESRNDSGMIYRFLFTYIHEVPYINEFNVESRLDGLINNLEPYDEFVREMLRGYQAQPDRKKLNLTDDAYEYLGTWRDRMNNTHKEKFGTTKEEHLSIMGKMITYVHRFAIILSRLRIHFDEKLGSERMGSDIERIDYENATKLTEYFINNTAKLLSITESDILKDFKDENEYNKISEMPENSSFTDAKKYIMTAFEISEEAAKKRLKRYVDRGLIRKGYDAKYSSKY